jgi:hypothetical protein
MALTSRGARSGLGESYIKAGALARVLQRQREVRRRRCLVWVPRSGDSYVPRPRQYIFHTVSSITRVYSI